MNKFFSFLPKVRPVTQDCRIICVKSNANIKRGDPKNRSGRGRETFVCFYFDLALTTILTWRKGSEQTKKQQLVKKKYIGVNPRRDIIATMKTLYNVLVLLRRTLSAIQIFMIVLRHKRRQGKK